MKHYFKIALATLAIASLPAVATDKSVMLNDDKALIPQLIPEASEITKATRFYTQ